MSRENCVVGPDPKTGTVFILIFGDETTFRFHLATIGL